MYYIQWMFLTGLLVAVWGSVWSFKLLSVELSYFPFIFLVSYWNLLGFVLLCMHLLFWFIFWIFLTIKIFLSFTPFSLSLCIRFAHFLENRGIYTWIIELKPDCKIWICSSILLTMLISFKNEERMRVRREAWNLTTLKLYQSEICI